MPLYENLLETESNCLPVFKLKQTQIPTFEYNVDIQLYILIKSYLHQKFLLK